MAISEADVRHVAGLARVGLPEARVPALVSELNGILAHMALLQGIDTTTVATSGDPRAPMAARPDTLAPDRLARDLPAFAPDVRDGLLLVPRLGTHDDTESA